LIESPILAIAVQIVNPYWNNTAIGYCNQPIESVLIGKGLARVSKNRLIFSGELCIATFPINCPEQLSFDLFLKVASAGELLADEYTGVIT